jgi:hypothetical protein
MNTNEHDKLQHVNILFYIIGKFHPIFKIYNVTKLNIINWNKF